MHIVELYGIWAEDVLDWFNKHILDSGGDGAGAIICANPREVSDYFLKKYWNGQLRTCFVEDERVEGDNTTIYFHDGNENYIFTNKFDFNFGMCADYVFKIKSECKSYKDNFTILPI